MLPVLRTLVSISAVATLLCTGCSVGKSAFPRSGPTVADIYHGGGHQSGEATRTSDRPARSVLAGDGDLAGFSRDSHNELRQLFPTVPNPVLVGYVYPHLAGGRYPVPGYTTAFPMYETPAFALPGEAALERLGNENR